MASIPNRWPGRTFCALGLGPLLFMASCGQAQPTTVATPSPSTTFGPNPTTVASTSVTATSLGSPDNPTTTTSTSLPPPTVTLPPDSRAHAEPVDAAAEFSSLRGQASLDTLTMLVIGAVEHRYPDHRNGRAKTDWRSDNKDPEGTVLVRRCCFADDSIAGFEYNIDAQRTPDGWVTASATKAAICYRGARGAACR